MRWRNPALLTLVWALLCLPNLGGPSLWDIDEGNNAQCAREMHECGNYIVPTFNYKLRVDKPVLLYWLQVAAYHVGGVNEFAARLPSALAALLALLILHELGSRLFNHSTGLLASLVLASSVAFCAAAHFANPDALLHLCVLLTLWCFWRHWEHPGGWWLVGAGAASGLGMLAKGPVALVLPLAITLSFLVWRGELRRLWDLRLLVASLAFLLVAAPWYIWVGVETKGEWLAGFFWKHNIERSLQSLENHRGPFYYYPLVLIAGLTPWSVFLGPTAWYSWKRLKPCADLSAEGDDPRAARQFLLCWTGVWLVFFTLVRTKLPNYILPVYPAIALLTASFLDDWRRGHILLPTWVMPTSLICLALIGAGVSVGLLVAGDAIPLQALSGRRLPGLQTGAWMGAVLAAGAGAAWWCARRERRGGLIGCVAVAGIVFLSALASWGAMAVDQLKAARPLAGALPSDQLLRDVRVGAFGYFQPSLVFYCRREIYCPEKPVHIVDFLNSPLPVYLFVTEDVWGQLRAFAPPGFRQVARHGDLYNGREIILVTNDPAAAPSNPR
jgi:4-amino-4-deoxy-L-arabinose transferase-like glycosyltransferase